MITFNPTRVLCGAVVKVALTIALSSSAFAHGMGGPHMGGNMFVEHNTSTTMTNKTTAIVKHDGRRFRFVRFGYVYPTPVCFYRWTDIGRVRICPDNGY